MSDGYNIIGDIAGNYKTFLALLEKMPKGAIPVSVGDIVDRGPKSKEVLEYLKANGLAVLGNHDHMMVDACRNKGYYRDGVWFWNGGKFTVKSFFPDADYACEQDYIEQLVKIDKENKDLLDWVENLPLYLELDGTFISHAIKNPSWPLETACDIGTTMNRRTDDNILWNHGSPRRMKDRYQICGHNSHWGLKRFSDQQGEYGICIDTSASKILTGIHWPSGQIYQQEYIDTYPSVKDAFKAAGFIGSED